MKHESRVDFKKLIKNLAEMYPYDVTEVVVVELVANALDAGANLIKIDYSPNDKILTVQDNGRGMDDSQFEKYHDLATDLKEKGETIGFAGIGAKISFNVSNKVVTETRSKNFSGGSNWFMENGEKLVWEEISPNRIQESGTRVEVHFAKNTNVAFSKSHDLAVLLRKHYLPLFDSNFRKFYESVHFYDGNLDIHVNGSSIVRRGVVEGSIISNYKLERAKTIFPEVDGKPYGYGLLGLAEQDFPVAPNLCGILLCTHGKVIKGSFFNQFPTKDGARILGVFEIPQLVKYLTTSKTDFTMHKNTAKTFRKYFELIELEFKKWLEEIGIPSAEITDGPDAKKLERQLGKIMEELPEFDLFFRSGRKQVPFGQQASEPEIAVFSNVGNNEVGLKRNADQKEKSANPKLSVTRNIRKGPQISIVEVKDRKEISWVEEGKIIINSGHKAYQQAKKNPASKITHQIFSIGSAVQKFLFHNGGLEYEKEVMFIDKLITAWSRLK